MCEGASNINKFEEIKCLVKISTISAFLAAYFGQSKRHRPLFLNYIMFFEHLFNISWQKDILIYIFCLLPTPLSVITGQDGN